MRILSSLPAVILGLLLLACGDESTSPPEEEGSTMKATVDGQAWTASNVGAQTINGQTIINGVGPNSSISIILGPDTKAGDHSLGLIPGASYTQGTTSYMTSVALTPGTLKLTVFDATHVAGTFSFTASTIPGAGTQKTVAVTGGSFSAKR